MQIGDKITVNKVRYSVYDLDEPGDYVRLRCLHARLNNKKCVNCGAKRLTNGYSEGDFDKEYNEDIKLKKLLAMLGK